MNRREVGELLKKAEQSLAAAELLLKDDFTDFSASRSYYAMFYCLEALLLNDNQSFSKHSAVIAAFGKDFIKTGKFPEKFHQYVLEAFELRNLGDYGTMDAVDKEKAQELINNAKELLEGVRLYLVQA